MICIVCCPPPRAGQNGKKGAFRPQSHPRVIIAFSVFTGFPLGLRSFKAALRDTSKTFVAGGSSFLLR
jgi:hypothetical protein